MQSTTIQPRVDFLGIGVRRAASSRLADQLRQHSRFWITPREELHDFDRDPACPSPGHPAAPNLLRRIYLAQP